MNWKCLFGNHDWDLVAYNNEATFINLDKTETRYRIDFYECGECGKRYSYTGSSRANSHPFINRARKKWQLTRRLPQNSYLAGRYENYKREPADVIPFTVHEGGKKNEQ